MGFWVHRSSFQSRDVQEARELPLTRRGARSRASIRHRSPPPSFRNRFPLSPTCSAGEGGRSGRGTCGVGAGCLDPGKNMNSLPHLFQEGTNSWNHRSSRTRWATPLFAPGWLSRRVLPRVLGWCRGRGRILSGHLRRRDGRAGVALAPRCVGSRGWGHLVTGRPKGARDPALGLLGLATRRIPRQSGSSRKAPREHPCPLRARREEREDRIRTGRRTSRDPRSRPFRGAWARAQ
jgi:hypothetical protein